MIEFLNYCMERLQRAVEMQKDTIPVLNVFINGIDKACQHPDTDQECTVKLLIDIPTESD